MESGQMIEWHQLDKRKFFVLGPSIFVFVRVLVYPFNLVKTRLFMQEKRSIYTGSLDAIRKIVRYEGVRGLYRGYFASLLGLFSGQLYIASYEMIRSRLHGYSTEVKGLVGGACATLVGQTVTVPVDIVTQHRMMQGQVQQWTKGGSAVGTTNLSSVAIIQKILNREGARGLYKGYTVSLLTYAPSSALWWSFYSGCYRRGVEHGMLEVYPMPLVQAGSGVLAGLFTSVLTNPLDVLRTRYQLERSNSMRATISKFWQEEGLGGVKKGLSARIMASLPTSAIMILSYEWIKRVSFRSNS